MKNKEIVWIFNYIFGDSKYFYACKTRREARMRIPYFRRNGAKVEGPFKYEKSKD